MADKELRKLKRAELLEMMLNMQKELDALKSENSDDQDSLRKELVRVHGAGVKVRMWCVIAVCAAAAMAVIVLISAFLLPVYKVTGSGMSPKYVKGDVVLCSKYADLEHGDIAAFSSGSKVLVKRVIGLPGDVVDIAPDGTVSINGKALDEPYIAEKSAGECDVEMPYTVPENRYFLMGDNRTVSIDSRSSAIGSVPDEFIAGKVILRLPW